MAGQCGPETACCVPSPDDALDAEMSWKNRCYATPPSIRVVPTVLRSLPVLRGHPHPILTCNRDTCVGCLLRGTERTQVGIQDLFQCADPAWLLSMESLSIEQVNQKNMVQRADDAVEKRASVRT